MRIDGSRYEHEPMPGKKISGMLFRFTFGVWNVGYADLQPWPEFGDKPLEEHVRGLLVGEFTQLVRKTLWFAGHDAKARRQNRNLLHGLNLPSTHRLFNLNDAGEGFRYWKIKMWPKLDLPKIPSNVRVRLDFNGHLSHEEFTKWWRSLSSEVQNSIDAIEDPYSTEDLHSDRRFYSDWVENPSWPGKVMKPSRDFSRHLYRQHRYQHIMFTHSLNHPLGQVAALWEAARFYKRYPQLMQPGGFSKVHSPAFKTFNDAWDWEGSQPKPAPGLGFGFDEQLEDLKWERLL